MDYGGFVGFKWKYLHTRKYILSVIGKRLVSNVMPESVKSVKEKERKKLKDKELWFL